MAQKILQAVESLDRIQDWEIEKGKKGGDEEQCPLEG